MKDDERHADAGCYQQQDVKNRMIIELQRVKTGRPALLESAILLVLSWKAI
jgi:hypothetical protein